MTKEDIIQQNPILVQLIGNHGVGAFQLIGRAMDEYAEQQAIAFDFWKRQNGYTIDASGEWYIKLIVVGDSANTKPVLANEVYNQFIEQQDKP